MGQYLSSVIPGFGVGYEEKPSFDPNYGFPAGRKERVMVATQEELISAKIPPNLRDYCAHLLIEFRRCKRDVFPLNYKCKHEHHAYEECQYEDLVLRMKEFEREKRLKARAEARAARMPNYG